jgi:predicted AAA+ superfamily ATPase
VKPLVSRHIAPIAAEFLEHFPGIVIEGARQVGKSTLAAHIAKSDAIIRNLDEISVREAAAADPDGFVNDAVGRQLVIDEIQRLPELTLAVKASIDRDRRPGRFIVTGSSSLLRLRGTADSLAGRVARLTMYGLSRGEDRGVADDLATAVANHADRLPELATRETRSDYAELLAVGAYPEVRSMPPRVRTAWIDSYLDSVTGRDLGELRKEIQPTRALAVLRTVAGRQSAELVKATLAHETEVPASTITGYLDLLHDVGLLASIPPWTPNLAKREIGRPKTFVVDSGLAVRLARLTPDQLATIEYGEALGSMLEAFVAGELLRQRSWAERDFTLFHYRTRDGDEVDLVLEFGDGSVVGVEVKASSSYRADHFAGLSRMRDRLGDRFVAGVVLGTGTTGIRFADRLYGAPIAALWAFAG